MKRFVVILIMLLFCSNTVHANPIKGVFWNWTNKKAREKTYQRQKVERKIEKQRKKGSIESTRDMFNEKLKSNELTVLDIENFNRLLNEYIGDPERYNHKQYKDYISKINDKIKDPAIIPWEHEKLQTFLKDPQNFTLDEIIVPADKEKYSKWFGNWVQHTKPIIEWVEKDWEDYKKAVDDLYHSPIFPQFPGMPAGFAPFL